MQFLDIKNLSLIMKEAADNRIKAFTILRSHYAGKGKPRVISLYTHLTPLKKKDTNKSMKDCVIRTETILTALRNAGQTVDDVLIIAMVLKSLPRHFDPFSVYVTRSKKELTFSEFQTELHGFEETLKQRPL